MSSKTVAEKIYLRKGKKAIFFNKPDNFEELLGGIPEGVIITENGKADILLAFIENATQLKKHVPDLKKSLHSNGALWIAYHKGTSSVKTDINRDSILTYASKHRLKGVAMISINESWSALRLKILH